MTVRAKLLLIFSFIFIGFAVNLVSISLESRKVQQKLDEIQNSYIPKIILGPKLRNSFESVGRTLQDAITASDKDTLERTKGFKENFLNDLSKNNSSLPKDAEAQLKTAFEEYWETAYEVSNRILNRESGPAVTQATVSMQSKHAKIDKLLTDLLSYDPMGLAEAFLAASNAQQHASRNNLIIGISKVIILLIFSFAFSRSLIRSLNALSKGFERFGQGDFDHAIPINSHDEIAVTSQLANQMADRLKVLSLESKRNNWLREGQAGLARELFGKTNPSDVANHALEFVASHLGIPMAALYYTEGQILNLLGHYALPELEIPGKPPHGFHPGEGLVGQAALKDEILIIKQIPSNFWSIHSGLGHAVPNTLILSPLRYLGKTTGVLELALFSPWPEPHGEFLNFIRDYLPIAIESAINNQTMERLLGETQNQAKALTEKEEALRTSNEELQGQQEELQQANEELEEQRAILEVEKEKLEMLTVELEKTKNEALAKSLEAQEASRHKSEFLANMSHELRTPLNGIMVLSQLMTENQDKNLNEKQINNAQAIYSAGRDLLGLINDILDLSKIEAGKLEIFPEKCTISDFVRRIGELFEQQAKAKNLALVIDVEDNTPSTVTTDFRRVEQILRNLLSNAIKFTEQGQIKILFFRPDPSHPLPQPLAAIPVVGISVIDSGIGIPIDKQKTIFESFKQLDSSVSRKYQGTGLGLTISLNLARQLGGQLHVQSKPGEGSTFTVYLPDSKIPTEIKEINNNKISRTIHKTENTPAPLTYEEQKRAEVLAADLFDGKTILVVDDDIRNIYALREVILPTKAKVLSANTGKEALDLLDKGEQIDLIIMDVMMPEMSGLEAIQIIRKNIKYTSTPIIAITAKAMKKDKEDCLEAGASDYLSKPVNVKELISLLRVWLSNIR